MKKRLKSQKYAASSDTGRMKDTVFVKDELNKLFWAVGEWNGGVVGEATTFLGLQREREITHLFCMTVCVLIAIDDKLAWMFWKSYEWPDKANNRLSSNVGQSMSVCGPSFCCVHCIVGTRRPLLAAFQMLSNRACKIAGGATLIGSWAKQTCAREETWKIHYSIVDFTYRVQFLNIFREGLRQCHL